MRKIVKSGGRWTVLELSNDEVGEAMEKLRAFNLAAWRMAVEDAAKLANNPAERMELAKILFDKYGMQSFSVLKNHSDNIMGG